MAELTTQEQIEQSRQQLEGARVEATKIAKAMKLPRRSIAYQLANPQFALSGKVETTAQIRKTTGQRLVSGISGQQEAFESEVAEKATEYAQPEYIEKAYTKAKTAIEPRIINLKQRIKTKEQQLAEELARGNRRDSDREDRYRESIRQLQAELGVYEGTISDKKATVQKYFSGQLVAEADYARAVEENYASREQTQKGIASSLGLSISELNKKFNQVQTGTSVETMFTPVQIKALEKAKILKYETVKAPQTITGGYYTSPTGDGMSIAPGGKVPEGYMQTATMSEVASGKLIKQNNLWFGQDTVKGFSFEQKTPKLSAFESSFGKSYVPTKVEVNPITGVPYGEVRGLTKEESFFYKIKKSKPYKVFEKIWEPGAIIGTAVGEFVAFGPGLALEPFFKAGRKPEDTSITAKVYRGGLMATKSAVLFSNPYTAVPTSFYFGGKTVSSLAGDPLGFIQGTLRYVKEEPYELAGGLVGAKVGKVISQTSFFAKKPIKITPTLEMEKAVEPFSRQRATLLLKTEGGKYVLGKTKSGEIISIGGGIEKGQTARTATLAELKQETGLTLKDISGFKRAGKVVTPEETFSIFTATLKKGAKLKASSDINKIVTISPRNIFIKGATGQTALQPISRYVPFKGRVRAYEAGMINYLETGVKPTWLGIQTKGGSFILGTQSRYDVPYKSQKQYLQQEELLLAHGTPQPAILKRWSPFNKRIKIEASKTKRGLAQGLYVQPPISLSKGFKPAKVFYHGTKGDYAKIIEVEGLKSGDITGARTALKWEKGNIYVTKKIKTAKWYAEMGIEDAKNWGVNSLPEYQPRIFKVGFTKEQLKYLSEDPIVKGEFIYRGGSLSSKQVVDINKPFTQPSAGYIGLSYLNIGKTSEGLGLKVAYPKRTAYIFRESPSKVKPTPKTFSGMESEFIIPPESVVSTTSRAEVFSIGLKKVYIQPSKIGETGGNGMGITGKTIAEVSSEGQYKYVTPGEIVSPFIRMESSKILTRKESSEILIKEKTITIPKSYSESLKQSKSGMVEIRRGKEKPYGFKESLEPNLTYKTTPYNYKTPKYKEPPIPYKIPPYKQPPYKQPPTPRVPFRMFSSFKGRKKKVNILKQKVFKETKYVPSIGASILRISSRRKSEPILGQTSYAPGFRPIISSRQRNKLWKKKLSLKI